MRDGPRLGSGRGLTALPAARQLEESCFLMQKNTLASLLLQVARERDLFSALTQQPRIRQASVFTLERADAQPIPNASSLSLR